MALELASCTRTSNMFEILPVFQKCEGFKTWGVNFQDYDSHGPIFTFSIGQDREMPSYGCLGSCREACFRGDLSEGWMAGSVEQALSLCLNSGEG